MNDLDAKASTGAKPYRRRPRKTDATVETVEEPKPKPVRKPRAKRVTVEEPRPLALSEAVAVLEPSRRSTPAERRAVILAALRVAASVVEDPSWPPSARSKALTEVRTLTSLALASLDEASTEAAGTWADGGKPVAS